MAKGSRVREPTQERSRRSLESVMVAGIELLAEEGMQGFTLQNVCQRAGVSMGMLYRRFRGRDELLKALQDRWLDTMERSQREVTSRVVVWEELSPAETVEVAVRGIVTGMRAQEKVARVIDLYTVYDDDELRRMAAVSHALSEWYRDGVLRHADAMVVPNPDVAVDFTFRVVLDTTVRRTTHGDDFATGRPIGDWDSFTAELCAICCSHLFGHAGIQDRGEPTRSARRPS